MAPPQHEIWSMFTVEVARIPGEKQHPDARCTACQTIVKNAQPSGNMLRHVLKCTSVDVESRARWSRYDAQRRRKKASKLLTPCQPTRTSASKTPSVTKRLFSTPQRSATRTSPRRRTRASSDKPIKQREEENFLRVAMGLIATGVPFRVVEEPLFQEMFDYKLPSRRQLSGRLLCTAYDREKERVIGLLTGMTELALVTDGWSNTNGDGIINFVFVNPKTPPIFWNSMDSKAESHTGRYIADTILSTILELEAVIGAGVVTAVVTDNAANMKKAWELVANERPGIVCTGCTAHGMNLLIKDIFKLDYFKQVLEKALTLARFIKHRRGLWSRFRDTQKQLKQQGVKRRRLSLTVATRWYTHEKCIRNVFQNRDVIAAIFADTAFIDSYAGAELDEATTIFKDDSFWKRARIALDLIQPINTSLAAFERDDCSISLVYQQFEWLRKHSVYTKRLESCEPGLQQMTLNAIENRRKKICSETIGIAHMLDQTKTMEGRDAKTVINAAATLARKMGLVTEEGRSQFHQELQEFVLEKWRGETRDDNYRYNPLNWWSLPSKSYVLVRQFAKILLSIPTSSASSERGWSIHGFIHTKLRNRLSPDKVNKLVFVYTNIARKSEVNHIMYQLFPEACDDSDSSNSSEGEDNVSRRRNVPMSAILQSPVVGEPHQEDENEPDNVLTTPFQRRQWQFTCQTR